MDIGFLPEEVFEEIASYLNSKDILSCCLVSKRWRNAVNANRIWFNLCAKTFPSISMNKFELIQTPCQVEPVFTPPKHTCDSLSEVCPWRLRFMQEAHLLRNWRFGRCVSYAITKSTDPCSIECDDDVLVIASMEKRDFTTWNISSKPKLMQKTHLSLWHVVTDFFKLSGNKLVVVQCTLLQVYTKNEPDNSTFDLTYRVLFNKSEEESFNIPNHPDISDWYKNNIGLYPSDLNTECNHNGEYFVGLIQEGNLNEVVFHIWDIKLGHKTAEQRIPETIDLVTDIHFSLRSSNLYILLKLSDSFKEHTEIHCFSLATFKYTDLFISFNYVVPVVLFGEKYLLNTDGSGKTLWLWKNEDGSFVDKLCCDFDIHPISLQIVMPFIIFAGNIGCNAKVKVFDIETLETECEFVIDYRVTGLLFIRSGLILVCGFMQLGLWDLSATKLHTLNFHDCLWANPRSTKTLVEEDDELFLLHFW